MMIMALTIHACLPLMLGLRRCCDHIFTLYFITNVIKMVLLLHIKPNTYAVNFQILLLSIYAEPGSAYLKCRINIHVLKHEFCRLNFAHKEPAMLHLRSMHTSSGKAMNFNKIISIQWISHL